MACMTHWCQSCGATFMNNESMLYCKLCGSDQITSEFDEALDNAPISDDEED